MDEIRVPFAPLAPAPDEFVGAVEREALRLNDRYLREFIEKYAFCPFAREGRKAGETERYVHYADSTDIEPLLALMTKVAARPRQVVVQVILPMIEVSAEDWCQFCYALTKRGHAAMGGPDVLACAPLHPDLAYHTRNPFALVPLFRRAPDPTIQWVRLDGLEALYEGRDNDTRYVDPGNVAALLAAPPPRQPLYHKVAESNAATVERLSLDKILALLADMAADGEKSYARLREREE